jgi:hypothetical protein
MKNSNDTIGKRSRDLPICSAVPQPLCHRVPHFFNLIYINYVLQLKIVDLNEEIQQ